MSKKRKKKKVKPRNLLVPAMRLHTKPGSHLDRKKELARRKCRAAIEDE